MATRRDPVWSFALFPALAVALALLLTGAPWSGGLDDLGSDADHAQHAVDRTTDGLREAPRPDLLADGSSENGVAPPAPAVQADDGTDDDGILRRRGLAMTVQHPDVAAVIAVQNRHNRRLLARKDVVGVATCLDARGDVAILVLTTVPVTDLPRFIEGVPVVSDVSGVISASKGGPPAGKGGGSGGSKDSVDPTARFDRAVPIGISTGHPSITAGTIGCRVIGTGGSLFALSNNHVFAASNSATEGDAVIQPGTYDGGSSPADDVGTLVAFVALDFSGGDNVMDAALASTDASLVGNATPADGYGTPKSTPLSASFNLQVQKYGRTTGLTNGKVYALNAALDVNYGPEGTASFVGQIVFTPGSLSSGGDSGSLIVGKKGSSARRPVALLFAGGGSYTIGTPIDVVLDAYDVTIDGE